ncbi:MAG: TetR/AcrR family transcriptional regulator [Leptospiraceae bacterium]|nr:TetR/AcrR family transcriptional regulator [Leptospiraceae bacterium]
MNELPFTYQAFLSGAEISLERICADLVDQHRDKIQIKKEKLAARNMFRIVSAVISLSQKKGFQGMSLRDLSEETGMSMGALYNYFGSKEELFEMIYSQGRVFVFEVLRSHASDDNPDVRLREAICAHLYLSEALSRVFSFFFMEARNLSLPNQKNVINLEQMTESFFEDILQEGKQKGSFSIESPEMIAAAIKALLQNWYLKKYRFSRRKLTVENYARFVIGFVSSNLR